MKKIALRKAKAWDTLKNEIESMDDLELITAIVLLDKMNEIIENVRKLK